VGGPSEAAGAGAGADAATAAGGAVPTPLAVYGILCLIFWALIVVVTNLTSLRSPAAVRGWARTIAVSRPSWKNA